MGKDYDNLKQSAKIITNHQDYGIQNNIKVHDLIKVSGNFGVEENSISHLRVTSLAKVKYLDTK